ncbi:MAG: hypothetical protein ACJAT5_000739 [Lentimonas sp.]|jgi:hypothetical protein
MFNKIISSLVLVTTLAFVGCVSHPFVPPGAITNASGPFAVTANQGGSKEGSATATGILGLFSFGDASTSTAARAGGVTKIRTVDVKSFNILGIYYTYTTVVTGE